MRIKDKLTLRHVGKDYIIIEPEKDTVDMTKVYSLNEPAAWLWEKVKGIDFSERYLQELLLQKYDVSEHQALEDARNLIEMLRKQNLIIE